MFPAFWALPAVMKSWLLCLQPQSAPAGNIWRVCPLPNYAFHTDRGCNFEHLDALRFEVFNVLELRIIHRNQLAQAILAFQQWQLTQIAPILEEQIKHAVGD